MIKEIKKDVFWVGFVDWNVRDFHGYETDKGSTYNAYIINDEKKILVDSVKYPFVKDLISNIEEVFPVSELDYIICNHAEPDHASSIPVVVAQNPDVVVVCNAKCQSFLGMQFDTTGWNFQIIKEGDTFSTGNRTLTFANTPMAHWPESMVTYLIEEKLLFSMDAFGQHYASASRFDDEQSMPEVIFEATKYYANIILPFGKQVLKAIDKLSSLEIDMIAPSHGIVWRSHIDVILDLYNKWATHTADKKVVVFYDSMWQSTEIMARAIVDGAFEVPGVEVKLFDVKATHITEIATQIIDCAAFAAGTPTLNMGMMPKMGEALVYLRGLAPQNKLAFAFGSYGWAKKAGPHEVHAILEDMKMNMLLEKPIQSQFRPTEDILADLRAKGKQLAEHAATK